MHCTALHRKAMHGSCYTVTMSTCTQQRVFHSLWKPRMHSQILQGTWYCQMVLRNYLICGILKQLHLHLPPAPTSLGHITGLTFTKFIHWFIQYWWRNLVDVRQVMKVKEGDEGEWGLPIWNYMHIHMSQFNWSIARLHNFTDYTIALGRGAQKQSVLEGAHCGYIYATNM